MNPAHESWVRIADGVGQNILHEGLVGRLKACRARREGGFKDPARFVWSRLPNRALTNLRHVVEHIVEHAVALNAQRIPIRRIESTSRVKQGVDAFEFYESEMDSKSSFIGKVRREIASKLGGR